MASITGIRKDTTNNNTAILFKGNAKLKDTAETAFMQYNLDAVKTCPYASAGCLKFCYAKRAERWQTVRKNHALAMEYANAPDFVERTARTILQALDTRRYAGRIALMRLHESGDFFSKKYLMDWIDITEKVFGVNKNFVAHFYTKSFQFILDLPAEYKTKFRRLLQAGGIVGNLSADTTTTAEQWERIERIKAEFPEINIYFALPADSINPADFTHLCECSDCGKCRVCSIASGAVTAVGIH